MSMMYCHKHDNHFDSDYHTECPVCEDEPEVEEIPMFKGTREALDKLTIKKHD